MAQRRMFSCRVISSDAFLQLPIQAKCLYFALLCAADDDGFVNAVRALCRSWGLRCYALGALIERGFVLDFPGDIVLITHWRQHNHIPPDRYRPSQFTEQMDQVLLSDQLTYIRWRRRNAAAARQQKPTGNRLQQQMQELGVLQSAKTHWLRRELRKSRDQIVHGSATPDELERHRLLEQALTEALNERNQEQEEAT